MSADQGGSGPVPTWARSSSWLFKALVVTWAALYTAGALVWAGSKAFDYDIPDLGGARPAVFAVFVVTAAAAGVVWLVGEGVAGYRSRD